MKASLDDHDYEPSIIRSFCLVSVHLYSMLEAGDDGNGDRNRQEQSVCKMGILQLAEYQRRPINPSVILLQDICSYGVYVV